MSLTPLFYKTFKRFNSPMRGNFRTTTLKNMNYPTIAFNPILKNQPVSLRPLGTDQRIRGVATGRETQDSIEVTYYEPITVLIPRSRVELPSSPCTDSPLATSLTRTKSRRATNKTHPPTGWLTEGSRGKKLFVYRVGSGRSKSMTIESRQEEVLVFLMTKLRVPYEETKTTIELFRKNSESTLDRLIEKKVFNTLHVTAVLEAELIDWEVATIIEAFGITF